MDPGPLFLIITTSITFAAIFYNLNHFTFCSINIPNINMHIPVTSKVDEIDNLTRQVGDQENVLNCV